MLFFKNIFGATKLNGKEFECNFTFLLSLKDGAVEPQVPHPAVPIKDVVLLKSLMDFPLHLPSGSLDEVTFHLTMIHIHGSLVCYDKVTNKPPVVY